MHRFFDLNYFISKEVTGRQESLLAKDLAVNHQHLRQQIDQKSALVIGGAGTIGASYIKALLKFPLKRLYVIDINENGLTELVRDIRSSKDLFVPEDFKTYPIDFGSAVFEKILQNEGSFEIIANFAAHKHVRSEKDQYSIQAMIENNVLKARKLLDLLAHYKPEKFFCVSTDKAANPVNIMGASKKLMEDLIMTYADKLNITTARFANVAFSNGSLPLGFLERINRMQPWSCPLNIKRYFVSPEEAGQICLMSSLLGDSGDIFFPKLSMEKDLIAFSDIAISLLKYLDLEPSICSSEEEAKMQIEDFNNGSKKFPVYFFPSDTTGEKAYEEFYSDDETLVLDKFENLGVIKNKTKGNFEGLNNILLKLSATFEKNQTTKEDIVRILKDYLPNFGHIEKGKNLDQRM
jgi:FlaA1/EpsC-like NDP-sugar epimerase